MNLFGSNIFTQQKLIFDDDTLRRQALTDNFKRGRVFALLIIIFETVFSIIDISAMFLDVHTDFRYSTYLLMYGLMILVNLLFLLLTTPKWPIPLLSPSRLRWLERAVLAYLLLTMTWGSLITLMDQQLYGQLVVFMVNLITLSVVFIVDWRRMLFIYLIPTAILIVGLPFFQTSGNLLVGHYVNLFVFIIIAWLASRLLYSSYCRDLASNLALISANEQLETKSAQIQQINDKLIHANFQLRQLSLVDDLTGIANRRGLRNFISQVFEQSDFEIDKLAVIVLDIDNFKLYNDNYGHLAGDQVLSAIAGVLEGLIRPPLEIAARWGGEEFIFLSFNISADSLADLAEKIRRQTESLGIPHTFSPTTPVITISVGTCLKPISSASEVAPIIEAADNALYIAKRKGRNQVSDGQSGPGEPDTSQSCQPALIYPVITPQQASVAAELAGRIWREHYTAIIGARQVEYMLNQFQTPERIWQDISQNDYRYDLVETAGQLAGYMAVKPDAQENDLFLSKLYIDRKFRKQGLARQMVDALIRRCRETGWQSIWLTVNKNNHASIAVYEKMGFIRTSSVVNEIGEGYVMDDYVMRLSLT